MVQATDERLQAVWRDWLSHGRPPLWTWHVFSRSVLARIPGSPRCKLCGRPFGGAGKVFTLLGMGPSRKNPQLCNFCFERLPPGGTDVDIAVLFVDVRGATTMAENMSPAAFAALMNRFYGIATRVLLAHGAVIDKLVGDQVMALFIPGICGPANRSLAARAGEALLREMGYGQLAQPWLAVGAAVHAGVAFVGNVGEEVTDFTALGDTVNTAARLQAKADAGELLLSEAVYEAVIGRYPNLEQQTIALRGRDHPLAVRVLRPTDRSRPSPSR